MNGSLIQCFLFLACTLSDTPKINKHTFSKNVGTFYKKYAAVLSKTSARFLKICTNFQQRFNHLLFNHLHFFNFSISSKRGIPNEIAFSYASLASCFFSICK